MPSSRRDLLRAAALLPLMPAVIGAAPAPGRKFLFVFNHGGWDTTRVLAPMFGARVAMEATAEPFTAGSLSLVDHRSRPSVRAFFEAHHGMVAVVNGILVPSVAHEVCARILMTGSPRSQADWTALIGSAEADRYLLPTLLMDAPSYPESLALAVARTGSAGQLDDLVTGAIVDPEVEPLPAGVRGAVDRYVLRHTAAAAASGDPLLAAFDEASRRSVALEAERYGIRFSAGGDLGSRTQVAVDVLAAGLSRVVSIGYPSLQFPWDSHYDNDQIQAALWEQLFAGLSATVAQLTATPGSAGGTMLDETVVVVLSEMGRTPALNSAGGKDHWPYTSAMLFGGGVPGDLTIGGHDDGFAGRGVDRASGEIADGAPPLDAAALGATLLALADVDPGELVPLSPLVR